MKNKWICTKTDDMSTGKPRALCVSILQVELTPTHPAYWLKVFTRITETKVHPCIIVGLSLRQTWVECVITSILTSPVFKITMINFQIQWLLEFNLCNFFLFLLAICKFGQHHCITLISHQKMKICNQGILHWEINLQLLVLLKWMDVY